MKFNPYHDRLGRFSTSGGATSFTYKPGASTAHSKAIEREKAKAAAEGTAEKGFKGTLYHGSPETDIKEFDMKRAGKNTSSGEKLIFFTDSKQMADDFSYERLEGSSTFFQRRGKKGRVYEVDVEMKNPLDFRKLSDKDIENIIKLDAEGLLTKESVKQLAGKNHQLLKTTLNLTADSLKKLGYDGFIANTGKAGHNSYEYAVVDSKQAKIKKGYTLEKSAKYNLFIGLKVENADRLHVGGGEKTEDFHITLAYGSFDMRSDEEDVTMRIQDAIDKIRDIVPDQIHFDAIKRFPASDSSDGKDVIYAQVASGHLDQAHEELISALKEKGIRLETTFDTYKPHMTLAYIDPGEEFINENSKIDIDADITGFMIGLGRDFEDQKENTFSIQKTDEDKRLVFGWANVAIRADGQQIQDLQNDIVDPEDLEDAVYEYVLHFRDGGEEHIPGLRKKAKMVESVVFTEEKLQAMGIPTGIVPLGWWIGFHVDDDEAWRKIKDGEYTMFSVEGTGTRQVLTKDQIPERVGKSASFNEILKFNPYHDRLGRFSGPGGAASFTYRTKDPKKQHMADMAIEREKKRTASMGGGASGSSSGGKEYGLNKEQHEKLERLVNSAIFAANKYRKEIGMSDSDYEKYKSKYKSNERKEEIRAERKRKEAEEKRKQDAENEERIKNELPGLNQDAIRRANDVSFFDHGSVAARDALKRVDEYRERNKIDDSWTDEQKAYAKQRDAEYRQLLTEYYNDSNNRFANNPSWAVTGPARYNVRSHEKKMNAAQNKANEYEEKLRRHEENTQKRLKSMEPEEKQIARWRQGKWGHGETISDTDPLAAKKMQAKLDYLTESQQKMKDANAYWRKNKTMDGFAGFSDSTNRKINSAMSEGRMTKPFQSYQLTNNNAQIKSTQSRLKQMQQM